MLLIVGLGNPGEAYQSTRHNIGWQVVEHAARRWGAPLKSEGWVRFGVTKVQSVDVMLVEPLAWMNQTGPVVHHVLQACGETPDELLVVHDDLDLPLGRLRFRSGGGTGGHRGLHSLVEVLQTDQFMRLKVGIGRPPDGIDPAVYVLSSYGPEEQLRHKAVVNLAVDALECVVTHGLPAAMNLFNGRLANG